MTKPKFEGVLGQPMPTHVFLSPVPDEEKGRMLAQRLGALFERYKLTLSDPKSGIVADDWRRLALSLAIEFIPGFQEREPWEEQRGPGAPPKRTETDWLEFLADVYAMQKRTGIKSFSRAVGLVAQHEPWVGRGFTYPRCNEFKRTSKMWKMVPMAAGGHSHETGVATSPEDFVIWLYGRKPE